MVKDSKYYNLSEAPQPYFCMSFDQVNDGSGESGVALGRTVLDMTGLRGKYDIDLEWTSDEGTFPFPESSDPVPPPDPQGQTILTALKDQLGLRVESRRAPVEVIVIDHVERPSAN